MVLFCGVIVYCGTMTNFSPNLLDKFVYKFDFLSTIWSILPLKTLHLVFSRNDLSKDFLFDPRKKAKRLESWLDKCLICPSTKSNILKPRQPGPFTSSDIIFGTYLNLDFVLLSRVCLSLHSTFFHQTWQHVGLNAQPDWRHCGGKETSKEIKWM